MTKLRTNHEQADSGMVYRVGVFAFIMSIFYFGFNYLNGGENSDTSGNYDDFEVTTTDKGNTSANTSDKSDRTYYLPTSTTGQIVEHKYYTLSYSEEHEQPEWVAYEITIDRLNAKNKVKRTDNFRPDPKVKTKSATPSDYRRSGYTRGHLVPAGDMNFDERAMSETFYMSNMSPQLRNQNMGIWRELEEQVRDWGRKYKHLYIVSGPVLTEREIDRIGKNIVTVPRNYYKVILDITDPEFKGIGFIIPNEISDEHLTEFAVTIDEIEDLTGIDFFPQLMEKDLEAEMEGSIDVRRWKFSEKRFQQRVRNWNRQ